MPSRKPDRSHGRNFRSNKASFKPNRIKSIDPASLRVSEATLQDEKLHATRLAHSIDESMGFVRYESGRRRVGWLCNMHSTSVEDSKIPGGRAAVDYYFLEEDGSSFKATMEYDPYFLIAVKKGKEADVEEWCRRKFEGIVKGVKRIEKEDLQMPNHLLGYRRGFLQLSFHNVGNLLEARKTLMPLAENNKKNMNAMDIYAEVAKYNHPAVPGHLADVTLQVPMLDSNCSTTTARATGKMMGGRMPVTTLSIYGSTMFLTTSELQSTKVI